MAGDRYDVIVIGAGANGLAAAATLSRAGRRTLLLERGDVVGGSSASFEFAPGFRASPLGLDAGWLAPAVARGLALDGAARPTADTRAPTGPAPAFMHIQPPMSLAVEPDRLLTLPGRPGREDGIASFSAHDAASWPGFVDRLRSMSGFLESLYQANAPDLDASGTDLLRAGRLALRFRRLGRARMTDLLRTMPMSVAELLDDTFESDALKAALAAVGVRGLHQGPRSGGTAFTLLHNLIGASTAGPAWAGRYRAGGPDTLTDVLAATARRDGVTIRTGAEVVRIAVRDDAVASVILSDGTEIPAGTVLSSADTTRTLLGMVDPAWLDPEFVDAVSSIRYRGCTSFVLYALDGIPVLPGLSDPSAALAGFVSLTPTMTSLERAADAAKYGETPEHPHVEFTVPSLRWPGCAPEGRHVAVARVQYTPHSLRRAHGEDPDTGWTDRERTRLADQVTGQIEGVSPGFADRVLHHAVLTPGDMEARYGHTGGSASQGEMMLDQILFMRPVAGWSQYRMPIDGLFLCGAATHPGPGVPGGPGWLAARAVLRQRTG